jgi:hypothetical protein
MLMVVIAVAALVVAATDMALTVRRALEVGEGVVEQPSGPALALSREDVGRSGPLHVAICSKKLENLAYSRRLAIQKRHNSIWRKSVTETLTLVPVTDLQYLIALDQPSKRCAVAHVR